MANDTFNGQAFGAEPGPLIIPLQLQTPGYHCARLGGAVKPVRLSVGDASDTSYIGLFRVVVPGGIIRPGACFRCSSLHSYSNSVNTKNIQHAIGNVGSASFSLGVNSPTTTDMIAEFNWAHSMGGDPVTQFRVINTTSGWASNASASLLTRDVDVSQPWFVQSEVRWAGPTPGEFIQLEAFLFELWP